MAGNGREFTYTCCQTMVKRTLSIEHRGPCSRGGTDSKGRLYVGLSSLNTFHLNIQGMVINPLVPRTLSSGTSVEPRFQFYSMQFGIAGEVKNACVDRSCSSVPQRVWPNAVVNKVTTFAVLQVLCVPPPQPHHPHHLLDSQSAFQSLQSS